MMLTDVAHALATGDEFPITVTRRDGPSLHATVKVRSV
jgi:copper(I)-binding protein